MLSLEENSFPKGIDLRKIKQTWLTACGPASELFYNVSNLQVSPTDRKDFRGT